MNHDWKQLEFEIDRDLAQFGRRMDVAPPGRDRIESISRAVADEARRIRAAHRLFGWRSVGLSAAAAVLLAVGFGWLQSRPSPVVADEPTLAEAEQMVDDWVSAAAGSADRLSVVVQGAWTPDEGGFDPSGEDAVDRFIESFERIEIMTGAS